MGALGERGPHPARRSRDAGAGARGPVPHRHAGDPGDAGVRQLHRRVLHPDRGLPGEDRLRLRGHHRGRVGGLLRDPPLPAHDAQSARRERRLTRDRAAGRGGAGAARRLHRRPGPVPRADPEPRPGGRAGQGRRRGLELRSRCAPDAPSVRAESGWTGYAPLRTEEATGELHRPPGRLRGAFARDRADRRDLRRAARRPGQRAAPAPGGLAPLAGHARLRRRAVHLAVGRAQGPGGGSPAARRARAGRRPDRDPRRRGRGAAVVARAGRRASRRGAPSRRVPGAPALLGPRHGAAGPGTEPGLVLRRDRAALGAPLRALRLGPRAPGIARVGAQVPDRRLARLGDPALRPGVHLRRLGLDRLQPASARGSAPGSPTTRWF